MECQQKPRLLHIQHHEDESWKEAGRDHRPREATEISPPDFLFASCVPNRAGEEGIRVSLGTNQKKDQRKTQNRAVLERKPLDGKCATPGQRL